MNLKNYFLAIIAGFGLIACTDKDDDSPKLPEGSPTYVNLSISLANSGTQKALPEDYNPDGDYEGNDGVETLDIYMIGADGTLEAKRFTGSDISSTGTVVAPSQPFRTTSGNKTIYVVMNSPQPLRNTVPDPEDLLPIAGMAQIKTEGGVDYDVITMTGRSASVYIAPDITPQQVSNGTNSFAVSVRRLASRVIVTTTASTDLMAQDGTTKIGTISDITYSVAQGTNQVYLIPKVSVNGSNPNADLNFLTWGSEYVPALGNYTTEAPKYYDYSDLTNPSPVPAKPTAADGYKSLVGKFLFENTHQAGDVKTSEYKKGNTAYVLVRATLTPEASAIADGGTLTNGTFYVGQTDGLIYSSKAAAQAAVQNQKVAMYQGGKMLQYAWLNPDNILAPINSPVLRNNIYHINITAFKKIGLNWNPLTPDQPGNPDPKPGDPDEPETPIDPIDPLTPEETYMSVEISVLNWTVHSYDIEF